MSPAEYLEAVKARLLTDELVEQIEIRRERSTQADAHLRARLVLVNHAVLEFSEYVVVPGQPMDIFVVLDNISASTRDYA